MKPSLLLLLPFAAICSLASRAHAQCDHHWLPLAGTLGVDHAVRCATQWDPDGAGPADALTVLGGTFTVAAGSVANHIVAIDPVTDAFVTLGAGLDAPVNDVAVLPNGDLVVCGAFTAAGGTAANRIASWDGSTWSALGSGSSTEAYDLAVTNNGELFATGTFQSGAVSANVARWDGTTWQPIAGAPSAPRSLAAPANGGLVVGTLDFAGGAARRWNGSTWSSLGSIEGTVESICAMANGDIAVAGNFVDAGGNGADLIAQWDGTNWQPLGPGLPWNGTAWALTELPGGDLAVGGLAHPLGTYAANFAIFDGTSWSVPAQGVNGTILAISPRPDGDLILAGLFLEIPGGSASHVTRWDGSQWHSLSTGIDDDCNAVVSLPGGDLVVGGAFDTIGAVQAGHVACWDGSTWSALGSGVDNHVNALCVMPNGDVIAGGWFTTAGGVAAERVARWDGSAWHALGNGIPVTVIDLVVHDGSIIAATNGQTDTIRRWDGTAWTVISPPGIRNIKDLAINADGDLLVAGFVPASPQATSVARWDGQFWWAMHGVSGTESMAVLPSGELYIGGNLVGPGQAWFANLARWDGSTWQPEPAPTSFVESLAVLADGRLCIGSSAGGFAANPLLWLSDGASWSSHGLAPIPSATRVVRDIAIAGDGGIVIAGMFAELDGTPANHIAILQPECPATATSYGNACTGSGGPNLLEPLRAPWTGASYEAVGTGMTSLSLVLSIFGFTQLSLPLPSILPQALPGCEALCTGDHIDVLLPTAGRVTTSLAIPAAQSLVGQSLEHYLLTFAFDPQQNLTEITNTNGLHMTVGTYRSF